MTKNSKHEYWPLWYLIALIFWIYAIANEVANPWYWFIALFFPLLLAHRFHHKSNSVTTVNISQTITDSEMWRNRLELVIDSSFDGIWDWDILNNQLFWSDRVFKMLELERGDLGTSFDVFRSLIHPDDRALFDKELRSYLLHRSTFSLELRMKSPKWDSYRFYHMQGKLRVDNENNPIQMAGSISNITRQKEYEFQLIKQAKSDPLTELGNRSAFEDALVRANQKLIENEDNVFAVILLDIDKFKSVNDHYDHKTGDQVLIGLSQRLKSLLKQGDQVYRIGGDEFAILMQKIRNRGDVTRLAGSIKQILNEPIIVDQLSIFISGCLGVVFSHDLSAGESHFSEMRSELIQQDAYMALYQAKQLGYGSIQVFNFDVRNSLRKNYRLEQDLRQALEKKQFILAYQPIVNVKTKHIVGFEVLLRWKHPEMGMISPVNFIPITEETGLICPIGEWIMQTAMEQFKKWQDEYPFLDFISINVSAPQILQKQDLFVKLVQQNCQRTGLKPVHLKLELTESIAMKDVEHIIYTLQRLNDLGIRISLDDFGTGYSSLSYLQRFKIHTLKIDRAFVLDIPMGEVKTTSKGTIVDTIIAMAKSLSLDIIAEGVEFDEQSQYLEDRGVEYIQGFLYSRPLSVEEVENLFTESELIPR